MPKTVNIKQKLLLKKNKLGGLRDPTHDYEAATKKYVDGQANKFLDEKGNILIERNIDFKGKKVFSLPEPTKSDEAANKKYVDENIDKKLEKEKAKFLPQDPATKNT